MREGYSSRSVCLCFCVSSFLCDMSVTELAATYLNYTMKVRYHCMYYVDFIENTLFESSGDIC